MPRVVNTTEGMIWILCHDSCQSRPPKNLKKHHVWNHSNHSNLGIPCNFLTCGQLLNLSYVALALNILYVCVCVRERESVSHSVMSNFVTLWTVVCQAPLSMEFSRQEYWSGQPFPSPGDLPHPGIKPRSPAVQADSLPSEPPGNRRVYVKLSLTEVSRKKTKT